MDTYCGRCGQPADPRHHGECARLLMLEPPRYCTACARRMKVQVSPMGWAATCVAHGEITSRATRERSGLDDCPVELG